MKGVNFIPKQRREQTRKRRRLRGWAILASIYAVSLLIAYAFCAVVATGDDQNVTASLQKLPAEIDQTTRSIESLRQQLAETQARLEAARAVARQPDWGILLALLANSVGDEIILTGCRLEPIGAENPPTGHPAAPQPADAPNSRAAHAARSQRFMLHISGVGRSQSDVSQFILRLERVGLFDQVRLIKTTREVFGSGEATGFRLEASLNPTEGMK